MRIRELYLAAFGPFTERKILLSKSEADGESGLCVLYGKNEAGKSSALRAVHDLLYGIPHRSPDDFQHASKKLRIGARLTFSDGEEFDFLRQKRQKNSILTYPDDSHSDAAGGEPAKNDQFDALIRSVPSHLFDSFFGLDHDRLREGAEALLDSEGELGQALFSAGLGGGNLRSVLENLDAEARELFKSTGKVTTINAALADLKKIKAQIASESLRPAEWKKAAQAARETERQLESLEAEIKTNGEELARLERLGLTLPALARFELKGERVAALSDTLLLANDFETRLRGCRLEAAKARGDLDRTAQKIDLLESKRSDLEHASQLVESRESIERLGNGISSYQDLLDQLPRREVELASLGERIQGILSIVGMSDSSRDFEALHDPMTRASQIRELADRFIEVETRLASADAELENSNATYAMAKQDLETWVNPPNSDVLRRALDRARKLGDVDDRLLTQGPRIESAYEDCDRAFAALGRWAGPLEEIDRTMFPERESVDLFVSRFEEIRRDALGLEKDHQRLVLARGTAQEQLSRLCAEGSVPSEEERDAHRSERDQIWREIRRRWIDGNDGGSEEARAQVDSDALLPERFENEVASADRVADRLRIEADRVAQQAQFVARIDQIDAELQELNARQAEVAGSLDESSDEWRRLWAGLDIALGTPAEMKAWLDRLGVLREAVIAARRERRDWQAQEGVRNDSRDALKAECVALGSSEAATADRLDELIGIGEGIESRFEAARAFGLRIREANEIAMKAQASALVDRDKCHRSLDSIGREFSSSVSELKLAANPRPREVHERLDRLTELLGIVRERKRLEERIGGMKSEVSQFEQGVEDLVSRCAPSLDALQPDIAIGRLRGLLTLAMDTSLDEVREEHADAQHALSMASEALAALRRESKAETDEGLDGALLASKELLKAREDFENEALNLAGIGQGRTPEELAIEAKDVDGDTLPGRISSLKSQLQELAERKKAADKESGAQAKTLADMDGSERTAVLAEEEQTLLATISASGRRYARLKLAREILAREIDRYRDENKRPLLARTTRFFHALTQGRYVGVQSEYDDRDAPELVVVQFDDEKKGVTQLSNGTRDQLYLALRLASLEESIEGTESMPFIADDILVEFDEERSRAALQVLASLARKNQILLFTHHAHVAEQAKELGRSICVVDL